MIKYTKEQLNLLYWGEQLSIAQIASQVHSHGPTIYRAMVRCRILRRSLSEANRPPKLGKKNPRWGGDKIHPNGGRDRARRMYSHQQPCRICGRPAERHHEDENPLNNEPSNIDWLCRRHHMEIDGRLSSLMEFRKR